MTKRRQGRHQDDGARAQVKDENHVLVELLRRMTWREKVKYIDRLMGRVLERM